MVAVPLVFAVLAGSPSPDGTSTPGTASLSRWADSEVRYLLTEDETREWKALRDDSARGVFIDAFWSKRDPVPATPENEYRDEIVRRVAASNALFREGRPGWLTDRGHIYILFGKPDNTWANEPGDQRETEGPFSNVTFGPRGATLGALSWTYRRSANPRLPANTQFSFRATKQGDYRLSSPLKGAWLEPPTSLVAAPSPEASVPPVDMWKRRPGPNR